MNPDAASRLLGRIELEAAGVDLGEAYECLIDRLAERLIGPGAIVIDGGANTGRHTVAFARRVLSGGRVHAFEPLLDQLGRNRDWARTEGVDSAIHYHPCGLFDHAGAATLLRDVANPALSSLRFEATGSVTEPVGVELDTLDRVFANATVDFVKLDVGGAEFSALFGGEHLIGRSRPFIVFENALEWAATCFGYRADDFFTLFQRLDLTLFDAFGRPFTAAEWNDPDAGWYFCAVPPERFPCEEYCELARAFWRDCAAAALAIPSTRGARAPAAEDLSSAAPFSNVPVLPRRLLERARLLPTREDILSLLPPGTVFCEVGVALGDFSARVLATCRVARFLAIDLFTLHRYPEMWGGRVGEALDGREHLAYYKDRFRSQFEQGILQIHEGISTEMLAMLPNHSVDVFYIDANHDYHSVKNELKIISEKVNAGGLIILDDYIMHDYMTDTPYGVVRATNEFMISENWEMVYFALHTGMFCNVVLRKL